MTKHRVLLRDLALSVIFVGLLIAPTVVARDGAVSTVATAAQPPAASGAAAARIASSA